MLFSMMQTLSCFGISLENTKNNIIKIKKNMILLCNGNLTDNKNTKDKILFVDLLNFHLKYYSYSVFKCIW
jgi:hypothetical protein